MFGDELKRERDEDPIDRAGRDEFPAPDAHLEMAYEDRTATDYWPDDEDDFYRYDMSDDELCYED